MFNINSPLLALQGALVSWLISSSHLWQPMGSWPYSIHWYSLTISFPFSTAIFISFSLRWQVLQEKFTIFVVVLIDLYLSLFLLQRHQGRKKLFLQKEDHGKVLDLGDFRYFMQQTLYRELSMLMLISITYKNLSFFFLLFPLNFI